MKTATARKRTKSEAAPASERFTVLSPTEVQDNRTGLIWSHTLSKECITHAGAEKIVGELEAAEKQGWRLPTVEELFCLADRTRRDPAIDTAAFPDTKSDWYWTSTPYAGDPAYAWFVYFHDGDSVYGHRDGGDAFVRAVRGPAARPGQ